MTAKKETNKKKAVVKKTAIKKRTEHMIIKAIFIVLPS